METNLSYFLFCMIVICASFALLFFILLMLHRIKKRRIEKETEKLQSEYKKMFTDLLFEGITATQLITNNSTKTYFHNKFSRWVLMEELLKLHHNFSGEYAEKIRNFYVESSLINDSYKKLNNFRWHIKCKGIKELTQMQVKDAYHEVLKFLNHRNSTLRHEAQFALVKLAGFSGLTFLHGYKKHISDWQQLNFISILNTLDKEATPDFSQFLHSKNESLTTFAILLITHFNQLSSVHAVSQCLQHPSKAVRLKAVKALRILQAGDHVEQLTAIYYKEDTAVKIEILKTLAVLGNNSHIDFLFKQLEEADDTAAFYSIKAIRSILNDSTESFLTPELIAKLKLKNIVLYASNN